jgi:hypothetical protein
MTSRFLAVATDVPPWLQNKQNHIKYRVLDD